MSTRNLCFHGEIRRIAVFFWLKKKKKKTPKKQQPTKTKKKQALSGTALILTKRQVFTPVKPTAH